MHYTRSEQKHMLFSSLTFLLYFLPAVLVIHYFLPRRAQNLFLLIASIIFYAWGEAKYVPLIIALLLINFALGRLLSVPSLSILNRKILLFLSVFVDIGVLIYYKYAAFLLSLFGGAFQAPNVTLPLGISFFTFQLVAYLIDVSKASVEAEKNPIDLGAFILLFPQLIAGPIIRYADMRPALHQRRRPSSGELQNGMAEFIAGLALKVLIANPLGEFHTTLLAVNPDMPGAWLSALAFGLQIYFDFFGYSLMAIGIGKMLGFDIPINFDHPYAARSVREFWRRWHITLGNWFRDYVYIPLGGSRKGEARTLFNLFCVWSLTGLWHGAAVNFMIPLRYSAERVLIYVFRPNNLASDLSDEEAQKLLCEAGYQSERTEQCILELIHRLNSSEDFPHEIGLFLSYPPEDVQGFIQNKAKSCKCVGCWKVYGDEAAAKLQFERYKKCTELYCKQWAMGIPVERLTVAV